MTSAVIVLNYPQSVVATCDLVLVCQPLHFRWHKDDTNLYGLQKQASPSILVVWLNLGWYDVVPGAQPHCILDYIAPALRSSYVTRSTMRIGGLLTLGLQIFIQCRPIHV